MSLYKQIAPNYSETLDQLRQTEQPPAYEHWLDEGIVMVGAGCALAALAIDKLSQSEHEPLDELFNSGANAPGPYHAPGIDFENKDLYLSKARDYLLGLPFVHKDQVQLYDPQTQDIPPKIIIDGAMDLPANRIIGVNSFKDWAGRPNQKKWYAPDIFNYGKTSLGAIGTYARLDKSTLPKSDAAMVTIAKDTSGEYWGLVDYESSHRTASQKLRGDSTIRAGRLRIYDDDDMPKIGVPVRDAVEDLIPAIKSR